MEKQLNYSTASLDDIVFEYRNKSYGAFFLRRIYNKHVTIATILAIALFILFISAPLIARLIGGGDDTDKVAKVEKVVELAEPPSLENKPPPPPPDLPPPPPPVVSTVKFTPPVIKKDEEVREEEEIPDQKELEDVVIATETVVGNTNQEVLTEVAAPTEVGEVVEDKIFTFVEQNPEFPGGLESMYKYLGKNIRYPAVASRNGLEGNVILQFVVGKQGEISDITVVKSLGGGTDEEAMRVVKSMPKWNPGKQNGRAVNVRYTLPVRFKLQ
ncbi:MAG: putative TonB-dependent receptor [uncultured Adhaeribacter sp.]|uniref:Putative TonB-dependent receptor n=1 Tax=uncultured Adhaeribacter sp. TaxID=448109 RepID=A0A6J4HF82_9BACT|nr:MAG: putative TonB-dependent receptor [uncultured Adhaeribacter sp.]